MFGQNPIRRPVKGDGATLDIQHIFPTVQGEGPYAGLPAVFVRLGGCNLACDFCDTEFEDFHTLKVDTILERVNTLSEGFRKLVVLTGGEPLRQPIERLCEQLIDARYTVQVETNGTLWRDLPESVQVVCSPKNPTSNGYTPVRPDVLERATALKFIVSASQPAYNAIANIGQEVYATPVYIQPMDEYDNEKNTRNLRHAAHLAAKHGARLSLQSHKIIGIE